MADSENTQTQATQPELKQLMNDIFGLSDDEEEEAPVAQTVQPVARQNDDAQLFDDESDSEDAQPAMRKLSRFSKGKKDSQKARAKSTEPKKRKRLEKAKAERKRREPAADGAAAPSAAKEKRRDREEDEDSYASESDVEATAEDQAFIDMDGDDAELMREYEEENPQHFHDDRPDRRRDEPPKELNIVDEAVMALKKPKPVSLEGEEKRRLAEDLVDKMRIAAEADKESRANNRPALEKLRVLPLVRQRVVNRQLQEELLESNLLTAFRAWLEPPASNELPTLELRSALYKMLYDLPIEASHLRHSQVGQIVMALYKHPKETVQHKKLLESIIQKWSRLIFVSDRHEREVEQPVRRQPAEQQQQPQQSRARVPGRLGPAAERAPALQPKETFGRVHVPISRGFNYKVRPESAVLPTAAAAAEGKNAGGVKAKLLKKSGSKGVDKNFRAERVSIGGRDHIRSG